MLTATLPRSLQPRLPINREKTADELREIRLSRSHRDSEARNLCWWVVIISHTVEFDTMMAIEAKDNTFANKLLKEMHYEVQPVPSQDTFRVS